MNYVFLNLIYIFFFYGLMCVKKFIYGKYKGVYIFLYSCIYWGKGIRFKIYVVFVWTENSFNVLGF